MNTTALKQDIERYSFEHNTKPVKAIICFDNNEQLELELDAGAKAPHNDTRKKDIIPDGISSRTYILCQLIMMAEENVMMYEIPDQNTIGKKGLREANTRAYNKYVTQLIIMLSEKGISRTNIYNKIQQLGKLNPESRYAKDIKNNFSEYVVKLALTPEDYENNPLYHLLKSSVPASYMRADYAYINETMTNLIRIKCESLERENNQAEKN